MKLKGKTYHKEILWAARYILETAGEKELCSEQVVSVLRDGSEATFGSVDAYCEGHLFDLKTGQVRDYDAQMNAYALGIMQRYKKEEITCHLIYSKTRYVDVKTISFSEAENAVYSIIDSVTDETRSPWLCDYCNWCARESKCTAVKNFGYSIGGQIEAMNNLNLDEPLSPAVSKRLLSIVGTVERWASGVRKKVKENKYA